MKHGKKSNLPVIIITVLITIIVMFIIMVTFLFSMGNKNKSIDTAISSKDSQSRSTIMRETSTSATSDSSPTSTSIDTKKLTTGQIEDWANAILAVSPYSNRNYDLETSINDNDQMAYVSVTQPQVGQIVAFRVNKDGNLEFGEDGWAGIRKWDIISTKYMDTSMAESYFSEKQKSQEANSSNSSSQSLDEDFFYNKIKKAWDDERAYIDSIDDPKVKQSVQSALSAAIGESTRLQTSFPDQADLIQKALQRVLAGN